MSHASAPHASRPHSALAASAPGLPPAFQLVDQVGIPFLAADIEVFRPGAVAVATPRPHGSAPHGALTDAPAPLADFSVLRVSDMGWVTRPTDPPGLQAYAPILLNGVVLDRMMDLTPGGLGGAWAWGEIRLADDRGDLAAMVSSSSASYRPVRVRFGRKAPLDHPRDPSLPRSLVAPGGLFAPATFARAQTGAQATAFVGDGTPPDTYVGAGYVLPGYFEP